MSSMLGYIITGQDRLSPVLAKAGKNVERSNASMAKGFGAVAKALATVSVVGAVASVKMASDFEDSMAKIHGLVGVSQKQVDSWSKQILSLATNLPQAPKELASALYFVSSAGLKGKEAMDALKASAKASAAGLGTTQVVADAVTNALNAYRGSGLTATKSTDILTAAVREGKAEAEDFSGSIGRVIPIASQLGVRFDQVAASMASMTLVGLNANEAATATRAILNSLLKPAGQSVDKMNDLGLSYSEVRSQLREKGLLATLLMLKGRIGDNKDALGKLFPNVRALNGFLALTGSNATQNSRIFKKLANATGDTDRAFKAASETAKFKFAVAMNKMRVVGIEFGAAIIPVLSSVMSAVMRLIGPVLRCKAAFITLGIGVTAAAVVFKAAMVAMSRSARAALVTSVVGIAILALTIALTELLTHWKTVWKACSDFLRKTKDFFVSMIGKMVGGLLWLIGTIIHGTARAFGWLPLGIGKSLKNAAAKFDAFRDSVNRSLEGMKSRTINVGVKFGAGAVFAPGTTRRAGYATGTSGAKPGWAWVGERGPELAYFHGGEKVIPHNDSVRVAHGYAKGVGIDTHLPSAKTISKLMDAALLSAAKRWAQSFAAVGGGAVGGGVARWAPLVLRALGLLGQSPGWLGVVLRRMNQESGGNPRAINLWDSNAARGTPSIGLMQVIGPTFAAYANGFRSLGIWNPFANIFAGLNYALHRYGSLAALNRPGGYDRGGWLMPGLTLAYNGTGRPERVLRPGQGGQVVNHYTINVEVKGHALASKKEIAAVVSEAVTIAKRHGAKTI